MPVTGQSALQTPAKPARATSTAQSDDAQNNGVQNNDAQQSSILAALFAQPALPMTAPIKVSTGTSQAVPSSVSGAGISPPLSPQPSAGNGISSNAAAVQTTDQAVPVAAKQSSFGIGTTSSQTDQQDGIADTDGAQANDGQANAATATNQAAAEPTKAQDFSALFPVAAELIAKPAHTAASNDDGSVSSATPGNADNGISGLTLLHQTTGATATHATGTSLATSTTMSNTPADQVSIVMQRAVSNGDRSMTISLDPVELGKVSVKLDISKDGSVQASISAERPETLTMLKNDHHTLTQALQNAGLSPDSSSLSFNLRDGGGSQQGQSSQQSSQNGSASRTGDDFDADADLQKLTATTAVYAASSAPGRVDVLV